MNLQRDLVLCLLRICPGGVQIRARDVVRWFHAREQLREWFRQCGPADYESFSALIENIRMLRDRSSADGAKATRGNINELRVSHFEQPARVFYRREVSALGDILGVLFLFNLEIGDAYRVIVLERQLYRLLQCNVTRSRRVLSLSRCQDAKE
ncbi:MAG: hypothetical protein WAN14_05955 [Candidatus Acidiferrales bacterium]